MTAPERFDIYRLIHKAIRAELCGALVALGRFDTDDEAAVAAAVGRVEAVLALCASHLAHENAHIHPALEACAAGSSAWAGEHHAEDQGVIERLAAQCRAVAQAQGAARRLAARALYVAFDRFVTANFAHMRREEDVNNPLLWQHYDDAAIAGIQAGLIASLTPQEAQYSLGAMMRALDPAERLALLAGARQRQPAEAFARMLATALAALDAGEREGLLAGLEAASAVGRAA